ncbi:MAG: phage portal protein [Phycisphaerae bacterium]|nr:phage portal protein [Phycisphaerae bacterium]
MTFEIESFQDDTLDAEYIDHLIDRVLPEQIQQTGRLWEYFRNPMVPLSGAVSMVANAATRPYMQAQEQGLPARITGIAGASRVGGDRNRKEVVVENDIAWRVHTMVDFLFGQEPTIRSTASDPELAGAIEAVIEAMLQANGGMGFLQEMALMGSVYGHVDVAVRVPDGLVLPTPAQGSWAPRTSPRQTRRVNPTAADEPSTVAADGPGTSTTSDAAGVDRADAAGSAGDRSSTFARAVELARLITLEAVEAPRILPILDEDDYRTIRYWVQAYHKRPARMNVRRRGLLGLRREASPAEVEVVEIISPHWWQRYEDRVLLAQGPNRLGVLPVVHVQNLSVPNSYEGLSDVEPLIPLQDELNTRLSDRANRVTFQSFKMYLGKGIEDFLERPVGPGQMWATHNLSASVEEFGDDHGSPSEDAHIAQVRSAMDKVSGVTPVAAGLINGNVGNLTSGTALKIVLGGLLTRTNRKRLTYGAGLAGMVELALRYLDYAGVLPTRKEDRNVEIHWPNPLPNDESEALRNAQIKAQLGLPPDRVLAELGYTRDNR